METRMAQERRKQGGADGDADRVRWQQEVNELRVVISRLEEELEQSRTADKTYEVGRC